MSAQSWASTDPEAELRACIVCKGDLSGSYVPSGQAKCIGGPHSSNHWGQTGPARGGSTWGAMHSMHRAATSDTLSAGRNIIYAMGQVC